MENDIDRPVDTAASQSAFDRDQSYEDISQSAPESTTLAPAPSPTTSHDTCSSDDISRITLDDNDVTAVHELSPPTV
ncbi:hypothetical protein BaRGS_00025382 [Batillaria attramentaria]|uniref:Uncharacterized protein n=1 Tax=Batillaria attramentaria TaxID=370345 RepID=A0ABD0JHZ0_9CAEN